LVEFKQKLSKIINANIKTRFANAMANLANMFAPRELAYAMA